VGRHELALLPPTFARARRRGHLRCRFHLRTKQGRDNFPGSLRHTRRDKAPCLRRGAFTTGARAFTQSRLRRRRVTCFRLDDSAPPGAERA
jgi:hypothetical protein